MSTIDIWKKCLEAVKGQIPSQHFNTWFKPISVAGINEASLELEVPNRFFLEWLKDHYLPLIQEAITKTSQREYYIVCRLLLETTQRSTTPFSSALSQKYLF